MDHRIGVGFERDFHRQQARLAHVHCHQTIIGQHRGDDALGGFHADGVLVGQALVEDKTGKTARAIAALLDLAAVAVENPVAEIGVGQGGFFHQQQLVKTHAGVAVAQLANLRGAQAHALAHAVDHHEIVAQAMHLAEVQNHESGYLVLEVTRARGVGAVNTRGRIINYLVMFRQGDAACRLKRGVFTPCFCRYVSRLGACADAQSGSPAHRCRARGCRVKVLATGWRQAPESRRRRQCRRQFR